VSGKSGFVPICADPLFADVFGRLFGGLVDGVFIDVPVGSLLSKDIAGKVVITTATGSLYLSDLLDRKPSALLAGCQSVNEIFRVLQNFKDKQDHSLIVRYYGPKFDTPTLTKAERDLLKAYLETGSLEHVLKRLSIKKKTALNRLSVIREKLQAKNYKELLEAYLYRSNF